MKSRTDRHGAFRRETLALLGESGVPIDITPLRRALLESAVACGRPYFIFSLTGAIYGTPANIPVVENVPTVPINRKHRRNPVLLTAAE